MTELFIELPADEASEFRDEWEKIRSKLSADDDYALTEPAKIERFDAATILEWVVPILEHTPEIIAALAAYIAARRGRVIIDDDKLTLEGYTASEVETIIAKHRET